MTKSLPPSVVRSVSEAVTYFDSLARDDEKFVVFRGQAESSWDVLPRIARPKSTLGRYESEIIREIISVHPREFTNDTSMFDRLVRMQHYGVPTRLIDVTVNPLVALWFATEASPMSKTGDGKVIIFDGPNSRRKFFDSDTVSGIANLANLTESERLSIEASTAKRQSDFNNIQPMQRLLQFVRTEKPHFQPRMNKVDLTRPCYVVPKMDNKRLVAQSGSFIIQGLSRNAAEYTRDIVASMVRIPFDVKLKIRSELDRLGVNGGTLFPEIEYTARDIVSRYERFL